MYNFLEKNYQFRINALRERTEWRRSSEDEWRVSSPPSSAKVAATSTASFLSLLPPHNAPAGCCRKKKTTKTPLRGENKIIVLVTIYILAPSITLTRRVRV